MTFSAEAFPVAGEGAAGRILSFAGRRRPRLAAAAGRRHGRTRRFADGAERAGRVDADYQRRRAEAEKNKTPCRSSFRPSRLPRLGQANRRRLERRAGPGECGRRPHRRAESRRPTQSLGGGGSNWPTTGRRERSHRRIPARAVAIGELARRAEADEVPFEEAADHRRRPPRPRGSPRPGSPR